MADVQPDSSPPASATESKPKTPTAVFSEKPPCGESNNPELESAQTTTISPTHMTPPPASVAQPVDSIALTPTQLAPVQSIASTKPEPNIIEDSAIPDAKRLKSEPKDEPSTVKDEPVADNFVANNNVKVEPSAASVAADNNPSNVSPSTKLTAIPDTKPAPPSPHVAPSIVGQVKSVGETNPSPTIATSQSAPNYVSPHGNPSSQQMAQNIEQPPPPPPPPRQPFPPPSSVPVGNSGQQPFAPYNPGPPPRNLPKTAKHRPKNARVFVGNLASEFTTPQEMIKIFYKYGELIEEPVLRRSFGFIQYSSPESASRAVAGEQARIIGGIPIDLSIADNREVKRGTHVVNNTPFPHGPKQNTASRKRRRSNSPNRRMGGVHPPQYRRARPEPRNGIHMRILCMSTTARSYARTCEAMFKGETSGLGCDVVHIVANELGSALGKCMTQSIPYVLVVASKDVEDGTCTIRTLERTGYEKAGRGNGIIPLREAINVCLIDRGIIPPGGRPGPPPPHLPYGAPQQPVQMVQAGWSQHAGGMHPNQSNLRKPGWMTGARAPPHPQPSHMRSGPPPPGGLPVPPPGFGPPQSMAPQMQMGGNQQQYGQQPYGHAQGYTGPSGPQLGWSQGGQQPVGYGAPPQDFGRGGGSGYPQGGSMMGGRNGSARDNEYDPTAVMPAGGRPDDGFNNWNASQDQYHNRGGGAMYTARPGGPPMPPNTQGNPNTRPGMNGGNSGFSMPPQGGYRPDQAQPYGNQAYAQRPSSYNQQSSGAPPQGNTYFNYGNEHQRPASWGPSGGGPYEGGNQNQGYNSVPGMQQRRDGGYSSPQQQGGAQPGRVTGNGASFNNTPPQPSQGGNNVGTPLVDIGKLTNLISTFTQQQNSGARGNQRNDGNAPRQSVQTAPGGPTPGAPRGQYPPYQQQMPQQQQYQQQAPPGQQARGYYSR